MVCPVYKNKKVRELFNEIISALGGRPMTEQEFASVELRNLRNGRDYSAMEAAYRIWNLNNGNPIDYTPDTMGETKSILFLNLLESFNGDRDEAIRAKSLIYSKLFKNWLDKSKEVYAISNMTDANGEPSIEALASFLDEKGIKFLEHDAQNESSDTALFSKADFSSTFGGNIWQRLLSGEQVSSQELFEYGITDRGVFHGNLQGMSRVLSKHDIPVMISESLSEGIVATTMTDEDGNSVIMINPDWINTVSKSRQGEILVHEMIHAITANALNAPKTAVEDTFKKRAYKVFNLLKNAVRNEDWHLFDVYGGLYALCDVHEFVSEFVSNPIARSNLYALAKEIDQKNDKKAFSRLKRFVNSLFKLFVNKNLFSEQPTLDQLKQYNSYLQNYLNGVNTVRNVKKFTRAQLISAYHNIDDTVLNNDKISILKEKLHKGMIAVLKHNIKLDWRPDDENLVQKDIPVKDRYNWIKNSLLSRINAILTSRLPLDTKTVLMSETKGWLDQMNNPLVTIYESLSQFLNALGPRIISALDELDNLKFSDKTDAADYTYQAHDNIGTFDAIIRDISVILKNECEVEDIILQYNGQNSDSKITKDDLAELLTSVEELSGVLSSAKGMITNLMSRVAISTLSNVVNEAGSIEGVEMIQNMVSRNPVVEQDVSWFLVQFGLADASPNEIVRAVANMIQKANDRVDDLTLDKCIKLILLADALKPGESILDLYEVVDGKRTGFIVRPFNYGKYRNEYSEYMAELNKKFVLPEKNNMPPLDETEAILWELERQDFILKHGELKYIPKYYEAWAKVPKHVKEQIGKLNGAMTALLQKYDAIDKDGTRHYEKITGDDDWKLFLSLKMSKRLMRETHDRFGNEKQGTDLLDALTLKEVYKELYGSEYKLMKTKKLQWNEAREKIIKQCGGHKALKDYLAGYESSFDFKTFDKWESRNSKRDFKRSPSGKPIVFEDFELELQGLKIDYGEEYRQLKERERSLLRPIYDPAGEPVPYLLDDSIKNVLLNEIYPRMREIREQVIKSTPGYAELAGSAKQAFDAFFKYVDTRYYRDIQEQIGAEMLGEDEDFGYDDTDFMYALADYGYLYEDWETDFAYVVPYKWFLTLVAKDYDYMEVVPNEAWMESDEERNYDNPVWKEQELDKIGLSVVPKQDLYKNEQWEKIENSPTLKALYDEIINTMHEANEMQTNRLFTNDYLLPGVSAKLFDRLKQVKGIDKLTVFLKWVAENLGINIGQDQDVLLRNETTAHDENTEDGEPIYSQFTRTVGRRGDGREYTALPQYFTRRLDNPEFTSGALLDIVLSYYKMSVNYNEKSKIKDLCDAVLDYVKDRNYYSGISQKTADNIKKYLNVKGADSTEMSNVYKLLKNLIDFGLYGKVKIQFKTKWFDFSKIIDVTRRLTTATNLGMNPKVAAVGFMTAMHAHIINGCVGKEYSFMSIVEAGIETVKHLIYNWRKHGFYSRKSQDKVLVLLEEFGIAQQLERKMTDLDIKSNLGGELLRAVKQNHTFGFLSTTDCLTKSLISIAILKDYKYIDGEIYSNADIEYMRHDKNKYKELRSKYKKAKSIYYNMKVKDGRIYFEDAGMNTAWKNNFGRIKAKCVKLSERADGVATGLQRAAILSSWIGMIIMIHRQFLPLMLQERYGDRVYDYDMLEYKNGLFRVMFKFLSELMMNNFLVGAPSAMLALSFFISNPTWILAIGTILSAGFRIYGASTGQHKSVKDIYGLFFNTFNDLRSTINSLENRWAMRLILCERALIQLVSTFLVGPVCKWADDDKDDFWLLTFAYWLKGSRWEINGPYNIEELVANIKSPTAMTSLLDRFNAVAANNNSGLLNWLSSLSLTEEEKVINNNSPYAGWTHLQRSWFKALTGPLPNLYEQSKPVGAYGKRKWLERLNFHERSGDNKDIYEDVRNLFK